MEKERIEVDNGILIVIILLIFIFSGLMILKVIERNNPLSKESSKECEEFAFLNKCGLEPFGCITLNESKSGCLLVNNQTYECAVNWRIKCQEKYR